MTEVQNDPDRVLHPLRAPRRRQLRAGLLGRRRWTRSARGCGAIVDAHGGDSVGWYMGNPGAFSYSHPLWVKGFIDALGSPHSYTASLPGRLQPVRRQPRCSTARLHRPDPRPGPHRLPADRRRQPARLARQRPERAAGQGPAARDHRARRARGRRRPAPLGDRAGVRARGDRPGRRRLAAALDPPGDLRRRARGRGGDRAAGARRRRAARAGAPHFRPEATEAATGVPADAGPRARPRPRRRAERAAVYGRTGSCLGRNGTLVAFLLDALNVVTGNLDREGGAMFGDPPIDFEPASRTGSGSPPTQGPLAGRQPARGARPLPASLMAKEIDHARARARSGRCSSPPATRCSRCPTATSSRRRSAELDLCVAIDLYVSDTARHCRLSSCPATTMYEREDFPLPFLALFSTPFIQMTDAVVEPRGEARQEWEIIEDDRGADRRRPARALAGRCGCSAGPA